LYLPLSFGSVFFSSSICCKKKELKKCDHLLPGSVAAMWVSTKDRQDKEKGGEDNGRGRGSSQVGVDGGQDDKEIEKQWQHIVHNYFVSIKTRC
jgi:hypothetical protein